MVKKLIAAVDNLFSKVDKTEGQYMQALERKEEQLLMLQGELQEKEAMLTDMHKMKLLGDVSEEFYDEEKQKVDALKAKFREAQTEIQLIQDYKTGDVKAVLEEMEATADKFSAEQLQEIKKLQDGLLQAKYEYIQALVDAGKAYDELIAPKRKIAGLREKLGMKKDSYISAGYEVLGMIHTGHNSYDNLQVGGKTVMDAIRMHKNPHSPVK
ncbi:hypothetical protein [Lysinibacillus capsici]|uniref:hypothetical protein n=1 Tax=Lysinibacillus capsici TaxID=2115968 RepID=UPI0034E2190B